MTIIIALLIADLAVCLNALVTFQFSTATQILSVHLPSSTFGFMVSPGIAMSCNNLNTVTGQYSYIANPCTTEPCLPGMVFAILADDTYYYLTVNNLEISENRTWDGYTPVVGDFVAITGYLREERDIFDRPFHTIEVVSLHPAK